MRPKRVVILDRSSKILKLAAIHKNLTDNTRGVTITTMYVTDKKGATMKRHLDRIFTNEGSRFLAKKARDNLNRGNNCNTG